MAARSLIPSLPSRLLLFMKTVSPTSAPVPSIHALSCRLAHHRRLSLNPQASLHRDSVPLPTSACGLSTDFFQPAVSSCVIRSYSKKASKEKVAKGGKKKVHMELTPEELDGVLNLPKLQQDMQSVVEDLKLQMHQQLSLRTSIAAYDNLPVKTEDGTFPLVQLGQIFQKNPTLIMVNLSSSPQYIPAVKEAIAQSGLNVNPQQEGTTIFIPVPKVTREHRENLAKNAKMIHDKAKTKLRDIHNKYAKKVKGAKEHHSEDVIRGAQELVLEEMHKHGQEMDALLAAKQDELLNLSIK